MEHLRQYTKEQLEQKTISELEWHYMDAYKIAINAGNIDSNPRLATVTDILFKKNDVREKRIVRYQIKSRLDEALKKRDYNESVIYRNMLAHYEQHIMG